MTEEQYAELRNELVALRRDVAALTAARAKQAELLDELVLPIAKEAMRHATTTLDNLEQDGTLQFGRELMQIGKTILAHYRPEDVRALGAATVTILDTVRELTQPEVMALASEAGHALQAGSDGKGLGLWGLLRATNERDVSQGLALAVEVLRRIGRNVGRAGAAHLSKQATQRDKVNALLAPRRARAGQDGPSHGHAPTTALHKVPVRAAATPRAQVSCATPAKAAVAAQFIHGVAFGADGHLVDANAWTRNLCESLADQLGVMLTEAHWRVIDYARGEFAATGASPNIRRITQGHGVSTKELYMLFPKAPGRTIAKLAGLPKPAGCL